MPYSPLWVGAAWLRLSCKNKNEERLAQRGWVSIVVCNFSSNAWGEQEMHAIQEVFIF